MDGRDLGFKLSRKLSSWEIMGFKEGEKEEGGGGGVEDKDDDRVFMFMV